MKVSEAMRLGSILSAQSFQGFTDGMKRCALGAVADATGIASSDFGKEWPWLEVREYSCPECGDSDRSPSLIIGVHLNDEHRWTRERIADWVATIEPAETSTPTQTVAFPTIKDISLPALSLP